MTHALCWPTPGHPSIGSRARACLSLALTLALGAPASAQLMQADFTGGTSTLRGPAFGPCCNTPFAGLTYRGPGNVSGHFVFDQSLIPSIGLVNVPLPSGLRIDPLSLVLGLDPNTLAFDAATGLPGEPVQVQYRDGVFNGFAYFSAFVYAGHEYELDVQGTRWTVYDRAGGVRNLSRFAANGFIDLTLSNVQAYVESTPVPEPTPAPEPASLALLATGLAGLVGVSRRRATR